MMKNLLKCELRKAFHNRYFFMAVGINVFIALAAAIVAITGYYNGEKIIFHFSLDAQGNFIRNPGLSAISAFNYWLGGEMRAFFPVVYYFLLFMVATLPFGWSLFSEKKSGYIANCAVRCKREKYYLSKYMAAFISGAVVSTVPMVMNFLLVLMFVPARTPDIREDLYFHVTSLFVGGALYYSNPVIYVLLYILIALIWTGLWATVCISLALFVKNRFVVQFFPFIFLLVFHFIASVLSSSRVYVELSLIGSVIPSILNNYNSLLVLLLWALAIMLFNVAVFFLKGHKKDVI